MMNGNFHVAWKLRQGKLPCSVVAEVGMPSYLLCQSNGCPSLTFVGMNRIAFDVSWFGVEIIGHKNKIKLVVKIWLHISIDSIPRKIIGEINYYKILYWGKLVVKIIRKIIEG